jgi:hypothetical protein
MLRPGGVLLPAVLGGCGSIESSTTRTTRWTPPAGYDLEFRSSSETGHTVSVELRRSDGELLFERTVTVGPMGIREYDEVIPAESGEYFVTSRLGDGTEATFSFTLDPGPESHFRGIMVLVKGKGQIRIDPMLS